MTSVGGAGRLCKALSRPPCSAHRLLSSGSEFSSLLGSGLYTALGRALPPSSCSAAFALCPTPMPQGLSYVLYTGSGLGAGLLRSNEDVFADLVLCRFNDIVWIDVSRVVARAAVN